MFATQPDLKNRILLGISIMVGIQYRIHQVILSHSHILSECVPSEEDRLMPLEQDWVSNLALAHFNFKINFPKPPFSHT